MPLFRVYKFIIPSNQSDRNSKIKPANDFTGHHISLCDRIPKIMETKGNTAHINNKALFDVIGTDQNSFTLK